MLLVEDDRVDRMAFERAARESGWDYDYVVADSVESARAQLSRGAFDVVVTDYRLGDGVAFEFFGMVAPACLVVTTASGDEEVAVAAMKSGADDYLIKDPERNYLKILPLTVASALERRRIRTEVSSLMEKLETRSAELEAANRELAQFSYTVAHDLRSPLRAIAGFASLLSEDHAAALDDEGHDLLRRINQNTERMHRQLEGLLALYQTQRAKPVLRETDLSELARQAAAEVAAAGPPREVELVIAPGVRAAADPDLLKTVFDNLLGNAFKYSSRKQRARIEFGTIRTGGETAYFVRDDGAGFDATLAGRLFKPFQRLHSTQEFPGIGIGLASVERIVRHHGGRVWAEGATDGGSTFYFTLGPG
jgi:light-regulated signal transduction histidine kinase (bacteriophytochrome)